MPCFRSQNNSRTGRAAECESCEDQQRDHIDLDRNTHRCDFSRPVGKQELVDQYDTDALHDIHNGGRRPDCQYPSHVSSGNSSSLSSGERDWRAFCRLIFCISEFSNPSVS